MKFQPRYYQQEAVDAIFNYFQNEDASHPIVSLPTGSGKSLVQAMIAERIIKDYPECRILFSTHQQEIIKQNYEELLSNMDNLFVDAGVYSAGLSSRDTHNQLIFAGIQSVYKIAKELGEFNLIVIDECHSLPKKGFGMYRRFLSEMLEIAPHLKIIGLTATPYRLDSGFLTDDYFVNKINFKIFDEIIYHISASKLIDQGFLCPLVGKTSRNRPDTSGVHTRGGEFIEHELNAVCNNADIIRNAVREILSYTESRDHVLLFCVSIAHAEAVRDEIILQGADCKAIHSELNTEEKEKIIEDFKNKKIKYIVNVNMLTTGFNAKHIDCICLLRPTMSAGLYYQMAGRGLRIMEGKENCLILDFAGNILRHGAIDKIEIISKNGQKYGAVGTEPVKECPSCGQAIHVVLQICPHCGYEYPLKHEAEAAVASPISKYKPPEEKLIEEVYYYLHEKKGRLSMRVSYQIDIHESISEWVCIEHEGYAAQKAREWMLKALPAGYPIPDSVEQALELKDIYRKPESLFIDYNQKFPRIVSMIYPEEEQFETGTIEEVGEKIVRNFVR